VALATVLIADQPAPIYTIQTVAGSNSVGDGGPALAAIFSQTEGITVDNQGNIYVADAENNRVRKISATGMITTFAGTGVSGFSGDGGAANLATLNQPYGLAIDPAGNLYIADLGNARIREVTPDGKIQTVAGGGSTPQPKAVNGLATGAQLNAPRNVTVDPDGTFYFSDFGANIVYRVSPAGTLSVVAGTGSSGYSGDASSANLAQLNAPAGLATDGNGSLYIADSGNNCIRLVYHGVISSIFDVTGPTGVAVSGGSVYVAARSYAGTPFTQFNSPGSALDTAIDNAGNAYFTSGQTVIEVSNVGATNTVAGSGLPMYFGGDGGPAGAARFHTPSGLAIDGQGNIYIADTANNRIRQIQPSGAINTIAGTGAAASDGDQGPAAVANLNSPESVAIDAKNNLYIADTGNNKIRKITPDGNIATLVDGLNQPQYVAVDASGAIYIADTGNDRVLKVAPSGTSSALAQVVKPAGLAVDIAGNVWISEATRVSKLTAAGDLSVVVDNLKNPRGLTLAANGTLIIVETGANLVHSWTSSSGLVTIAGTGIAGDSGDEGLAASAQLNTPSDVAVDSSGIVWLADSGNDVIRTLRPAATIVTPPAPEVAPATLVNAASLQPGNVAPGEIITIFGAGFDPKQSQLLFDGKPATTFYVGTSQINALAPATLTPGSTTHITITTAGVTAVDFSATVAAAQPGIFTTTSGTGQAAALNQDGTVNSSSNPAARGSVIVLYATGQGQSVSGVSLTIGGYPSGLLYAGPAPGFPGLMQINAEIPAGFMAPGVQPVVLSIGNAYSQPAVTIALR
jgi:uncharacterized protein (TIGR03437 family)